MKCVRAGGVFRIMMGLCWMRVAEQKTTQKESEQQQQQKAGIF